MSGWSVGAALEAIFKERASPHLIVAGCEYGVRYGELVARLWL